MGSIRKRSLTSTEKLQAIYDAEINIVLSWFWDGGINAQIGYDSNMLRNNFESVQEAIDWLYDNTVGKSI